MLLGCIADDFTGASDVANEIVKNGMSATLFVGAPDSDQAETVEAGVVALKTRSCPPSDAVAQSLATLAWLRGQGAEQILFKYCSTFDSTPQGNIGPVAEALAEALRAGSAVVCPAFPANGRTIYMGHLFVHDRLLNETGMAKHPLTPMTDPDLRRWLRLQTRGEVGLVPYAIVQKGPDAIREAMVAEAAAGRRLVVVDALTDDHLRDIGRATAGAPLVTGGSGIAIGLPANFSGRASSPKGGAAAAPGGVKGPGIALSGSCSVTSRKQVAAYASDHPALRVDPASLMDDAQTTTAQALDWIGQNLDRSPLVYTTTDPEEVALAQKTYGAERVSTAVEAFLGAVAVAMVDRGVHRIVVGGGETSGAVVTALGLKSLQVGQEIDPGVPALRATRQGSTLGLALKSGNFGRPDFYAEALDVLAD